MFRINPALLHRVVEDTASFVDAKGNLRSEFGTVSRPTLGHRVF